tara:strand:+ start:704 stop:1414 length:711 start_codon:yes stop_codon:yes gene_type:complete
MAVTLAKDIIDRAKIVLQDTSVAGTRWPNSELQAWLNDAQFAVVLYRPDAKTVNEEFTPTANSSKQTIPLTGLRLIEVIRNTAATSTYKAIRLIQRSILDDQVPAWHNATASVNIEHFVYDERDPKVFYLFPRPTSATRIELIYSTVPAKVSIVSADETFNSSASTTMISLDDIYANALLDFMLYRAYSKDAEFAANAVRSSAHLNAFGSSLGVKSKIDGSNAQMRSAQGADAVNS